MKKWLLVLLLSVNICAFGQSKYAHADDWMSIVGEIISWGVGDGFMKQCAKWLGCDEYEDTSLTDQLTGLYSSNQKVKVCSANSLVKNISRIAGTALLSAIIPPPASYIISNLAGNALQCLQAYIQLSSVKSKIDKYELCFPDKSDGHPLALTDKQIAKVLPKMGLFPTVDNIVAQYKKLCIKKVGDEDSYRFYNEGDMFDGVYIHHANGYAYVMCASLFEACPCVMNLQGGKINEPEYARDENDIIRMRSDGSLIHEGDDETNRTNEEEFHDKYAKHCRLIRYKEVYEQSTDLASIYSDACFDLHGYSRRNANITAGLVQCIEDTARNIFEKPVLSVQQRQMYNGFDIYNQDYSFVQGKYNKIIYALQERTYSSVINGKHPAFLKTEIADILALLKEIWFSDFTTYIVDYTCDEYGNAKTNGYQTNIYDKYIVSPAQRATANCCSSKPEISSTCYTDVYSDENTDDIKPSITADQTEITLASMFNEINKIQPLLDHIAELKIKASKAETIAVESSGFTLTLFDIFRNKIQVIAIMAIVFWFMVMGWKMINGDFGKINTQEFAKIALKMFVCSMIVFGDGAKTMLFTWTLQTAQGVGMFFNETLESFRSQQDNKYNQVCNMKQNARTTPKKVYADDIDAPSEVEKQYICQDWEDLVCTNEEGETKCLCYEYKMSCTKDRPTLHCSQYYKDYDGAENKDYCKKGTCSSDSLGYIKAHVYKTNKFRDADEYNSYVLTCPSGSEDQGCSEYKTVFGKKQCVKRQCKKFSLVCETGSTLACQRYDVLEDGTLGGCVKGVCVQDKSTFVLIPPLERPYKIKTYYNFVATEDKPEGPMTYQPYCHQKPKNSSILSSYLGTDKEAKPHYSASIGQNVFVCENGYELDDGFRIKEYIRHGIISDDNNSILVFQSLLPTSLWEVSDDVKVAYLKEMPVPTAVATVDENGLVTEYNFIDENNSAEGFRRSKYRTYIRSLLSYVNKNASYPKIKEYGITRDYSHLSFWDSMDCKIIQFISMQGMDGGFTDDVSDVITNIQNSNTTGTLTSALNGMMQFLKFMFMGFPFGILVFILMFGIGAALFMLVARAAQQYCICVFHLVVLVYLSPFVFILWLFNQTQKAFNTWFDDIKQNVLGACVPFVSISMFLFVIDWLMFGDADNYVSMKLFLPSGEINSDCYEDHLSDAPIACLTKRCLQRFTWLGLLGLNQGGSFYSGETFKMLGYLVLRCFFAASVVMSLTSILDKLEDAIYNIVGGKPQTEIGVGFNGKAGAAIKDGASAGLSAGKFALSSMSGAISVGFGAVAASFSVVSSFAVGIKNMLPQSARESIGRQINKVRGWFNDKGQKVGDWFEKKKQQVQNGIRKAGRNVSNTFAQTFNTSSYQNHMNRVNQINQQRQQSLQHINNTTNQQLQQLQQRAESMRLAHEQQLSKSEKSWKSAKDKDGNRRFNDEQVREMVEAQRTQLNTQREEYIKSGNNVINNKASEAKAKSEKYYTEIMIEEDDNW